MSIRFKVILPYLLLTLLIAVTGAYVVTRLVSSSLEERLTNQLLEAGRVVSDTMARQELEHVQNARVVAFTSGLADALLNGDLDQVARLAKPAAGGLNVESLFVYDGAGKEAFHSLKQLNGSIADYSNRGGASTLSIVNELVNLNSASSLPRRIIAIDPVDERYYYFTAIPIEKDGRQIGVVVVGTSLNTLAPLLEATASADIVFYDSNGQAMVSTIGVSATDSLFLRTLKIDKAFYDRVYNLSEAVEGENFEVEGRQYRSGFNPLMIGDDRVAVFAVFLPLDFVVQSSSINRNLYIVIYSIAMLAVIGVGFVIARSIITPLFSLVKTSQTIAGGDLSKRTDVRTNDEIGVLASTFDVMTDNLQQRTLDLENANQVLEQMDRAKIKFIQISAHELRTPLTLVQGYAQLVELKSKTNPEIEKYAKGIVDGAARMVEVVDNLLDASRIDSNLLTINATEVQVPQLIEESTKTFGVSLNERNISLAIQNLDQLPAIQADSGLLSKVFYHLVMNAIKYTPDGGSVMIIGSIPSNSKGRQEVEIQIKDTGIGVDPQNQKLVFEKFYQTGDVMLHSSGKTKFKGGGPGLGLAISRGIIEAHHGQIWLESPGYDEDKFPGTTVFVRLPVDGPKK